MLQHAATVPPYEGTMHKAHTAEIWGTEASLSVSQATALRAALEGRYSFPTTRRPVH